MVSNTEWESGPAEQLTEENGDGGRARFQKRLAGHYDELKRLYTELYGREDMFEELCREMYAYFAARKHALRERDDAREREPDWFCRRDMLGMMLYIDNFAGNLRGVQEKLPYLEECHVNYVHLMPFLDSPKGRSDGGYAVADFRKVRPDLGTMEDLARLADACHERDMNVCMDFVMNHTSEDHAWAKRAREGDAEYRSRYFFYDTYEIPAEYEKTVPQVFPTTAPGNFTFLPDIGQYVMTTFYPYQWDLNYGNPRVFNDMMYDFLYLANQGMDIIRIDAVPYIWKELGTRSRNLPQVHTIVRMMRMISEVVCPSVVLLGEVVMEPERVAPYFGTVEKPECHMLYNVTTMATTWNSVATKDIRLLRKQTDAVSRLPREYTFLNYLRCHDDIGWGLDYDTLGGYGMQEVSHKRFLNDFFTGKYEGSFSRGELYNDDPVTQDARFCGTCASMCGIEAALSEGQKDRPEDAPRKDRPENALRLEKLEDALRLDIMLHAYMLTQSGIPMLYSGDEIGQTNDYSYREDAGKREDSRYLHRGAFRWDLAARKEDAGSVQGRIFGALRELERIRREECVFEKEAAVYSYDVKDDSVLGILREYGGKRFLGLFNFSDTEKRVRTWEEGRFTDLVRESSLEMKEVVLAPHDFLWAVKEI